MGKFLEKLNSGRTLTINKRRGEHVIFYQGFLYIPELFIEKPSHYRFKNFSEHGWSLKVGKMYPPP